MLSDFFFCHRVLYGAKCVMGEMFLLRQLDLKIERLHHFTPVSVCTTLEENTNIKFQCIKKKMHLAKALQSFENPSALQRDLVSLKQYFFFWFSSEKAHPRTLN